MTRATEPRQPPTRLRYQSRIPTRPGSCLARRLANLLLLLAAALLQACATNPVTGDQDLVLMSEREEIARGAEYHKEILKEYSVYDDPELQRYVDGIGQQLAAKSHRSGLKFHFTVLDSPEINAFALPGGYVYITRGIMAYLNSEAELAGVVGHEIGHVTARHSVRQQSTSAVTGIVAGVLAHAAGINPNNQLVDLASTAFVRGYGRDHELEADRLGAEYLARSGRDPENMIEVVRLLKNQQLFAESQADGQPQQSGYHALFATHPDNDTRLQQVIRAARRYKQGEWLDGGRERYLRAIDGMIFGPSAEQGVVRDGSFYHLSLDAQLRAPRGWRIDNRPDSLLFIHPDETALSVLRLEDAGDAEDPRAWLQDKLDGAQLADGRPLRVGDWPGYAATGISDNTPWGRRKVRFACVLRDGNAWLFLATSKEHVDFELLIEHFDTIPASLRALDAAGREAARPLRIRLVRGEDGGYRALRPQSALEGRGEARLRLLNGDYPGGEPQPGALLKVVR